MRPFGSTIDPEPTMSTICGAYETFFASLSIIGISPMPLTEMLTTLGMTLSMMSAKESGSPARADVVPSETAAIRAGRRLRQYAMVLSGIWSAGSATRPQLNAGGGEAKPARKSGLLLIHLIHGTGRMTSDRISRTFRLAGARGACGSGL